MLFVVVAGMAIGAALREPAVASSHAGAANCALFPADDVWHADVSGLPVHARSDAWIGSMGGGSQRLHPDFGPSSEAMPYGIPYQVVAGERAKVKVTFDYSDESDAGPYPFGADTPVEGGSDRHALMLDKDNCRLYELYAANYAGNSSTAGSGAIWDLRSHALRPSTWTSADAAGLPILPGLLRRDEVAAGAVDHAIRMTAQRTDRSFVWPARHQAGAANDANLPPMGAWFRLKSSFDIARFRPDTQAVLRAMQVHGMVLADNGSNWYFTGAAEDGWDPAMLDELKSVTAGSFEAIDMASLMADPDSGQIRGSSAPAATTAAQPTPAAPRPPRTTAAPKPTTTSAAVAPVETPTAPPPTELATVETTTMPTPAVTDRPRPAPPKKGGLRRAVPYGFLAAAFLACDAAVFLVIRRRRRASGM
jgi:hypothetical protein